MNLSLKTYIYGALVLIALVVIGVGGKLWLEDHDAKIQAAAELKSLQGEYATLQAERDQLKTEREQIKSDTQSNLDKASAERDHALKSATDAAAYVSRFIGSQATLQKPKDEQGKPLPDAPSELLVKDPIRLAEYVGAAQVCQVKLEGCQKELTNAGKQTSVVEAQGQNQSQQISVIDKAKNGSKKAKLKWAAVGALAGGVVIAILKKH